MPSRALTVVLNSNHNKKIALLLPDPERGSHQEFILREARNKFRSKGLTIVYLRGGTALGDSPILPDSSVEQVWVSKGEPYSGPPADQALSVEPGKVFIISGKSFIDDRAIQQIRYVAGLQGVRLAVGMPDLHPGSRFPIGCAIASEGVYPALIGSDVGCGIALYRLSTVTSRSTPSRLASLLRDLDDPWSGDVPAWLANYGIQRTSAFDTSIGTIGSGNHFAEICKVERILDASVAQSLRVSDDSLYLLVHTGSRGLGGALLDSQTQSREDSNPYLEPESAELAAYMVEHDYAVQWAVANRDLVAHRIKECLYPNLELEGLLRQEDLEKIIDVTHNSATKHLVSVEGETRDLWVHRKGAAPADQGTVPCPGSRGDFSWLLQPTGDGYLNAHSLAHGAGRRYGRNALHGHSKNLSKGSLTTTSLGSEVICTDADLLIEEQPVAYKDVGCVVDDMEAAGVCKGVLVLRPVVTYKVREKGER